MGNEILHIIGGRVGDDLARRAALHDPAAFHQGNAVADLERLVQIMADEDDRALQLGLQVQKFILQPGADQRVQRRERLIHQQDRGLGDKGAGKANALLHAARQFAHLAVRPLRQVHQRQLHVDLVAPLVRGLPGQFKAQPHILAHRPPGQQPEGLENHGDIGQPQAAQGGGIGLGHADHLVAVQHPHFTPHHRVKGIHPAQQCGFSRTGKPHQHQNLALAHRQRTVMHAQDLSAGRLHFGPGLALIHHRQRDVGAVAEHDRHAVELYGGGHAGHLRVTRSIRSSTMATTTITKPDSNPSDVSTRLNACTTGLPSPSAPT